ncbi:hypothetical protein [Agromyces larvae]|uniref:HTH cro/C1-type domain-containing protein n=1 Tax=Agromyces larvae TaxID=2929802 RepID=A0ABY4C1S8_9MICO|nr:hypothetical protein [Agromyces larvae]UOE42730.1 hypothetical protein MTO99_11060 [Agromyces larvae]
MSVFTIRDAVARMPYSKSELARRAHVSRTTALSVSANQSRARVDTLRELALALGYDISIELDRASDPLAAAAARVMLGETALREILEVRELDAWIARLERYVGVDGASGEGLDTLAVITEAARVSGAHHREGAVMFSGRNDADRLVSAGRSSGARWVLSGSASLEALGADPGKTVVFWAEDAKHVAELLTATHRQVKIHAAADVIVAPAHPSVFAGSTTIEDVNLVSPMQGIIDAVAIGGIDREIAEQLAGSW